MRTIQAICMEYNPLFPTNRRYDNVGLDKNSCNKDGDSFILLVTYAKIGLVTTLLRVSHLEFLGYLFLKVRVKYSAPFKMKWYQVISVFFEEEYCFRITLSP